MSAFQKNQNFIGRINELEVSQALAASQTARILILYGRRRIGKTALIEQAYRQRQLLKFEGLEGQSEPAQMRELMRQLAQHTGQPLLAKVAVDTWQEVLEAIADVVKTGEWTVYFEEIQWIANYKPHFVAALKYVWDNYFRHNPSLLLILCGSSPSFIIKEIVHSKALYNRSSYEMHLGPLTLLETQAFYQNRSQKEVMDAYLTVGGVPEYLKWLNEKSSVFLSLCEHAFLKNSAFLREIDKIFVSSFSDNPHYKKVIEFLSLRKFAGRADIMKHLKIQSGGAITKVLNDLELCGFIQKYVPYNLNESSPLARYAIEDEYLQFYYRFVHPIRKRIQSGEFDQNPTRAMNAHDYSQWLGYAFERFCRRYSYVIAKALEFSGVQYEVGSFFNRATESESPGYQIDLLFDRKDQVYTICEIKYLSGKIGVKVIEDFERKLQLFPNKKQQTIQRVLIINTEAEDALINRGYFDRILNFKDLFNPNNWPF